jgi:hypothetical protein
LGDLIRDGEGAADLIYQAAGLVLTSARAESVASWQTLHAAVRAWDGRDLQDQFEGPRREVANALAEAELTAVRFTSYIVSQPGQGPGIIPVVERDKPPLQGNHFVGGWLALGQALALRWASLHATWRRFVPALHAFPHRRVKDEKKWLGFNLTFD